jgi:hypothetical protein
LVLVIAPAYIDFNNNRYYDNDQALLNDINFLLSQHIDPLLQPSLDVHEIKEIISNTYGDDFNLSPKSIDLGFFYYKSKNRVELIDLSDAVNQIKSNLTKLEKGRFITPYEFLDQDIFYLASDNQLIDETLHFINHVYSNDLNTSTSEAYEDYIKKINNISINPMNHLYRNGFKKYEIDISLMLIDYFNPDNTLWVTNGNWHTEANEMGSIQNLIFEPGLTNIPTFQLYNDNDLFVDVLYLEKIYLPSSVKNISTNALPSRYFQIDVLVINTPTNLYIQQHGLAGIGKIINKSLLFSSSNFGSDYSEFVDFVLLPDGTHTIGDIDFESINTNVLFSQIETVHSDNLIFMYFYSFDLLMGHATNAIIVNYFLSENDSIPYYIDILETSVLILPDSPSLSNKHFSHWRTEGGLTVDAGDLLDNRITNVYAVFEEKE